MSQLSLRTNFRAACPDGHACNLHCAQTFTERALTVTLSICIAQFFAQRAVMMVTLATCTVVKLSCSAHLHCVSFSRRAPLTITFATCTVFKFCARRPDRHTCNLHCAIPFAQHAGHTSNLHCVHILVQRALRMARCAKI